MINFYNYFNFFFFKKKNFYNIVLNIWINKLIEFKKIIIFSVLLNSTKTDIKIFVEKFICVKVMKINTSILKKNNKLKKKSYISINEFI